MTSQILDPGYVRPRDPVEIWLAERWHEVLGFVVGSQDNFFGMGGNSIDAAQVINAIWERFEIKLPLNAVTANPTVEQLAGVLRAEHARLPEPLVEIQSGDGTRSPLFLVHPASGQIAPYCHLAHALGEEYSVYGLQPIGLYSDDEPIQTVPAMAKVYVDAITSVDATGPYHLGGCAAGAVIAFEMACQLADAGATVRLLADIQEGPLGDDEPMDGMRSQRIRQANTSATSTYVPGHYGGVIDVFHQAGQPPSPTMATARTHPCAPDEDAIGGQLANRIRDMIDFVDPH